MSISQHHAIVLDGVGLEWPDGTVALDGLDAAFGTGRTGLIGANGTGKTTLLRLILGELEPSAGTIAVSGSVGYLPQQLSLRTEDTVAALLGVRERLDALRAIEAGDASPERFDALADDWDVEARAEAALDRVGLAGIPLDRPVGALSGGETVLIALIGLQLAGHDVLLLDEPTNNLDRRARRLLHDLISSWRGTLLVVSHDVELLNRMDDTAELLDGAIAVFGGPYDEYREHVEREQQAAEQALRTAEQTLKTERRQRIEAQTKLARRQRYARTDFENKRKPKMIMNLRKGEAQVSAGKLRGRHDARVEDARAEVDEQAARLRRDSRIRIELPETAVPASRRLAELEDAHGHRFVLQGPERVALTGPNGIGKTRLLATLFDAELREAGAPRAVPRTGRIGLLPQRLDHLDDGESILATIAAAAPEASEHEIRADLARFLFRGDRIRQRVGDLSGGERFRVALARLLLARPAHQLLVLDEPTNSLDLPSVDAFVSALEGYHGGLLVVSHDEAFLARLGIGTWLELDEDGLRERGPDGRG
ncbi:ABC-F family ATP-binding cassette domain-containing protein [Gulosibacter sp. 10]|uniref:ABC-F family ATP-binding cassette domain-containing protein n=1 Tax=Gulosibacter sp. 10 TaxID=1255570 RepID=UPI00097EE7E8|nr:ABC-F family ATP-binding cassette domain-containing protein [Gulosibacter sp. 10]SJM62052.1 ABC transporter ATP-binding protein [Gulosibacter sp. 10]